MKSSEKKPLLYNPTRIDYHHHRNQIITVAGVTLTLFATGNITGFSAVTIPDLMTDTNIKADHEDLSWIASLVTIGGVIGTLTGGLLSDALGRKSTIMLSSLFFCIGWLVIGLATNVAYIFAGRLLTGMAAGIYSTTVQVYICEIVDPSIRGVSGSLPTLMVCIGVLTMYTMGSFLHWRMLAFVSSVFPLLVLFYMIFLPESPVWLISKGRHSEAVKSLTWLRDDKTEAQEEICKLQNIRERRLSLTNEPKKQSFTLRSRLSRFTEASVLKPLGIGTALFFFQKFCGVSSITFYATLIFQYADNYMNNYVETIIVGIVRLFSTLIGIFMVKFFKRKPLLIASGLLMFFSNGVLGSYFFVKQTYGGGSLMDLSGENITNTAIATTNEFLKGALQSKTIDCIPLICITVFMVGSSIGFAIIPWFLIAELMPSDVRSLSCSFAYGFCQLSQFLAVKTFLNLVDLFDTYGTFWIYSGVALCGSIFVIFVLPETSDLNASQIEKLFDHGMDSSNSSSSEDLSSSINEDEIFNEDEEKNNLNEKTKLIIKKKYNDKN